MITKERFQEVYGQALDQFAQDCGSTPVYYEEEGECLSVVVDWKTPHDLDAKIVLFLEDDGIEAGLFLNRQPVNFSRKRSWATPHGRLLTRLRQAKDRLDDFYHPPLWSPDQHEVSEVASGSVINNVETESSLP